MVTKLAGSGYTNIADYVIPLAYDYNMDNTYSDLRDPSRSVSDD